ncbi:MAG: murein biosynthesis integral membrane protein MurJ [Chitinivibrionales bacterium]|nr:murein biosynthesis integral membrane protein MurJ [Chitinivibrionales bacterium]
MTGASQMEKSKRDSKLSAAALIMSASVLLSRIIGIARDMVFAKLEGTSDAMDAYVAAFLIPELLNHFIAGGFLSITFIPLFQKHLLREAKEQAWDLFSNILTIGSIVTAVFVLLGIFFTDDLLRFALSINASENTLRSPQWIGLTVKLTRIVLPAQLFFYWGFVLIAVQYAHKRFLAPSLMGVIYNLGIIALGTILHKRMGIEGFAWGVLIGAFAGAVIIQIIGARLVGLRFRPLVRPTEPDFVRFLLLSIPFVIGMGMTFSNEILFRLFGMYLDRGAIAGLNYALRLMMVVVGIIGQAAAQASYPFMSQLAQQSKLSELNTLANSVIAKICTFAIPLSAVMIAVAPEVVAVIYQHGEFGPESARLTSQLLSLYLIGAFALSSNTIVMRNFYATQNTLFPMVISTLVIAVSIPFYMQAISHLGVIGVPLTNAISMLIQFVVLYLLWSHKKLNMQGCRATLYTIVKIWLIAAVGAVISYGLKTWLGSISVLAGSGKGASFMRGLLVGAPALLLIFLLLDLTGISSVRHSLRSLLRRRS